MIQRIDPALAAPLFAGWEGGILRACLQGVMGEVYAPAGEKGSALASLGDFTFLAGVPRWDLAAFLPPAFRGKSRILVPCGEGWDQCIQTVWGARARPFTRYATKAPPTGFDRAHLACLADGLGPGDVLCPIDGALYAQCLANSWSRDLVSQFPTAAAYARLGLGMRWCARGRWWRGPPPMPDTGRGSRSRWTPAPTAAARAWLPRPRPP